MELVHNAIRNIEFEKEKVIKIFSILREYLFPKFIIFQRQLNEFLATKASYDKFSYTDLNIVEVASYALCKLINILDIVKENWKKELERIKLGFIDYISRILC